jgi:tRNA dimethylallyltransferase
VKDSLPLIVIVGPTASGKTGLSIKLAKEFNGEIISADSRAIYRGLDIGTAKPSVEERRGIVHWGIDLINPGEYYTAADFKRYADAKIDDIRSRGHLPILAGGSGLYIDAILFNFEFGNLPIVEKRTTLQKMDILELQNYCVKNNIKLPDNIQNKRHLIRTIERDGIRGERSKCLSNNTIVVGITTLKKTLHERIAKRAECMIKNNVVNEATMVADKFGWNNEAMTGNIYSIIKKHKKCVLNEKEMLQEFIKSDMRLVKKQMTWFRKNPFIVWGDLASCERYLMQILEGR